MEFPKTPTFKERGAQCPVVEAMQIPTEYNLLAFARIEVWSRGGAIAKISKNKEGLSFVFLIKEINRPPESMFRRLKEDSDIVAIPGEWIVKGVDGKLFICKPAVFEKIYESAGAES